LHPVFLHRLKYQEALVGEAAGYRDRAATEVGELIHDSVVSNDERATVSVTEVDDPDGHALRAQGNRHRRDHETGLDPVRDECLFDFRKTLKHPGEENGAGCGETRNVIGHRASQVARNRNVGDIDPAFVLRQPFID
jgi:hypothetical protein